MSHFMRKPNVLIHLEVSPEESLARIKSRARGCEVTITLDYLRHLHDASVRRAGSFLRCVVATWICLRRESRAPAAAARRRGIVVRWIAAPPRLRRGYFSDELRRRRGRDDAG